jgi:hypothetical protein
MLLTLTIDFIWYPGKAPFKAQVSISSRVQIAFPFLQGWIPTAGSHRPRSGTLDLQHFLGLTVDSDLHARASVTVMPVCLHYLMVEATIKSLVLFATARR